MDLPKAALGNPSLSVYPEMYILSMYWSYLKSCLLFLFFYPFLEIPVPHFRVCSFYQLLFVYFFKVFHSLDSNVTSPPTPTPIFLSSRSFFNTLRTSLFAPSKLFNSKSILDSIVTFSRGVIGTASQWTF